MLAWAAPVLVVVSGNIPDFLKRSQDRQASDPADVPAETEDASDDPVIFAAISKADLLPLIFVLQASHLTERAWSPSSPVRPPNNFITI
jgi:hypothetical protein